MPSARAAGELAIVEAAAVEEKLRSSPEFYVTAIGKWVEYANFKRRLTIEREQPFVAILGVSVIDEHAHAHSASRGANQRLSDQVAALVAAKDEILEIERALGCIDHLYSRQESVDADGENMESGHRTVRLRQIRKMGSESGFLRTGEGDRGVPRIIGARRKARAATAQRSRDRCDESTEQTGRPDAMRFAAGGDTRNWRDH